MGIDCTCTLGTRSAGWDDFYEGDPDILDAVKSLPVYDDLIDPFCPVHALPVAEWRYDADIDDYVISRSPQETTEADR